MTENTQTVPLQIDIVSDVVCPWCIIGYKRLQKALAMMPGQFDEQIHWRPFELNPDMPEEGEGLNAHITRKYRVSPEQSQSARARITEYGAEHGFQFDYFDEMKMVNTFRAHQLLYWAVEHGLQTELKLALFKAFFSERKDVNDIDVLVAVASSVGLAETDAREVLQSGRYAQAVRKEQKVWQSSGIVSVPTFIFNRQFMVPGAQEEETLARLLEDMRKKSLT